MNMTDPLFGLTIENLTHYHSERYLRFVNGLNVPMLIDTADDLARKREEKRKAAWRERNIKSASDCGTP